MMSEVSKAAQEIAKTTRIGIEAAQHFAAFVSRLIGEPLEDVVGILLGDKLKFVRAERCQRLMDRWSDLIRQRKLEGKSIPAAPKLVFPILEAASLEQDDELQDRWASLLTSAVDPSFSGSMRIAFVDILKQLEISDVHILDFAYNEYVQVKRARQGLESSYDESPTAVSVLGLSIMRELKIDAHVYQNSIDNLIRSRCIASFREVKYVPHNDPTLRFRGDFQTYDDVTYDHGYDSVCMTSLGVAFVEACLGKQA